MDNLTDIQKEFLELYQEELDHIYNMYKDSEEGRRSHLIRNIAFDYYTKPLQHSPFNTSLDIHKKFADFIIPILRVLNKDWDEKRKAKFEAELLRKEALALIAKQDRDAVISKLADEIRAERAKEAEVSETSTEG